ncbi:MAG TPA: hypothetical protein DDW31_05100 [candidate division Zixibacteria bacterium]|jgi:hypothetical protein|nr:hypothetical protein [candidate division Zixibacteria bacterium]
MRITALRAAAISGIALLICVPGCSRKSEHGVKVGEAVNTYRRAVGAADSAAAKAGRRSGTIDSIASGNR